MMVRIGHCKQGLQFEGDVAKIEVMEDIQKVAYILTDWDRSERIIYADKIYSVIRIGNKEFSSRLTGELSVDGKPTTYDLASDFENARAKLISMGVDIDRISFYLPDEHGFIKRYGPMPLDEAQAICYEYWFRKGGEPE